MRLTSLAALAIAATWCGSLSAQTMALRVGRQVRVTAPAQRINSRTLTLFAATPDTLVLGYVVQRRDAGALRSDTARIRVATTNIRRLEVRKWRTDILKDAAIGAGAGALAAFLLTKAHEESSCSSLADFDLICWTPGHAGQNARIGGVLGLAVGFVIGASHAREEWKAVPISAVRGLHLGLISGSGGRPGVRLGMAL
jgi:hypothetical protein